MLPNALRTSYAFVTGGLNAKLLDAWLNCHCLLLISFCSLGSVLREVLGELA